MTTPQNHLNRRVLTGPLQTGRVPAYLRGLAQDYDGWARMAGGTGWRYLDVLPHFRRSEDNQRLSGALHAHGGPLAVTDPEPPSAADLAFLRSAQQFGMPILPDFNAAGPVGCGIHQLAGAVAEDRAAEAAFIDPIIPRPNLRIVKAATAQSIKLEGGRATGIRYRAAGQDVDARAGLGVVLAAGGVGSPCLLMRSGIGPGWHLSAAGIDVRHDLPAVGENLHGLMALPTIASISDGVGLAETSDQHKAYGLPLGLRGPRHGAPARPAQVGAYWRSRSTDGSPDILLRFHAGGSRPGTEARTIGIDSVALQPASRGTVRLSLGDPQAPPEIDPGYSSDGRDRRVGIDALRIAREVLRQPGLSALIDREILPGPEVRTEEEYLSYARARGFPFSGLAGSCRMGTGDDAVVDPELRVHGLDGLWICDASIMPQIVSAEPFTATVMIAERGAEMIRNRAVKSSEESACDRPAEAAA